LRTGTYLLRTHTPHRRWNLRAAPPPRRTAFTAHYRISFTAHGRLHYHTTPVTGFATTVPAFRLLLVLHYACRFCCRCHAWTYRATHGCCTPHHTHRTACRHLPRLQLTRVLLPALWPRSGGRGPHHCDLLYFAHYTANAYACLLRALPRNCCRRALCGSRAAHLLPTRINRHTAPLSARTPHWRANTSLLSLHFFYAHTSCTGRAPTPYRVKPFFLTLRFLPICAPLYRRARASARRTRRNAANATRRIALRAALPPSLFRAHHVRCLPAQHSAHISLHSAHTALFILHSPLRSSLDTPPPPPPPHLPPSLLSPLSPASWHKITARFL